MDNVHVHVRVGIRVGSDHLEKAVDDMTIIIVLNAGKSVSGLESARTASSSPMTGAMPVRSPRANAHIARRAIRNTVERKGGPGTYLSGEVGVDAIRVRPGSHLRVELLRSLDVKVLAPQGKEPRSG